MVCETVKVIVLSSIRYFSMYISRFYSIDKLVLRSVCGKSAKFTADQVWGRIEHKNSKK